MARKHKKNVRFSRTDKTAKKYEEINLTKKKRRGSTKRRAQIFRTRIISLCVIGALFLFFTYIVISSLHPIGVYEYFKNLFVTTGSGEGYDIDIEGGKPIYTATDGKVYYVVTDSTVNCYNTSGKVLFEQFHTFENPVLKKSETRYMLYDQGERELSVGNLFGKLYSLNLDNGIICTDISDSGYFAVATKVEGYESSVSVYNKKNEKIFEWFSSTEMVNSVALSKNGKTLSVATVKVENGNFISNVYMFKYKSATPIMQKTYNDEVVYQLLDSGNKGFFAIFDSKVEFLNYKKESTKSHESEYSVSLVKQFKSRTIVLRTVAANQDKSVIEVLNSSGEVISSFEVNTNATDITYNSGKLYILGHSNIYKYNIYGKLLADCETNYDTLFIEGVSDNTVACIRSSVIEKINLSKVVN